MNSTQFLRGIAYTVLFASTFSAAAAPEARLGYQTPPATLPACFETCNSTLLKFRELSASSTAQPVLDPAAPVLVAPGACISGGCGLWHSLFGLYLG